MMRAITKTTRTTVMKAIIYINIVIIIVIIIFIVNGVFLDQKVDENSRINKNVSATETACENSMVFRIDIINKSIINVILINVVAAVPSDDTYKGDDYDDPDQDGDGDEDIQRLNCELLYTLSRARSSTSTSISAIVRT